MNNSKSKWLVNQSKCSNDHFSSRTRAVSRVWSRAIPNSNEKSRISQIDNTHKITTSTKEVPIKVTLQWPLRHYLSRSHPSSKRWWLASKAIKDSLIGQRIVPKLEARFTTRSKTNKSAQLQGSEPWLTQARFITTQQDLVTIICRLLLVNCPHQE